MRKLDAAADKILRISRSKMLANENTAAFIVARLDLAFQHFSDSA